MVKKQSKSKKSNKAPLSLEERRKRSEERAFMRKIRSIFSKTGFTRYSVNDRHFTFLDRPGELDDLFVLENLIVFAEYTMSAPTQIGDHIKGKSHLFNKIYENQDKFIDFLGDTFPELNEITFKQYHKDKLEVRIIYCSPNEVKSDHRALTPQTIFMWKGSIEYFKSVTDTVRFSARDELFHFLNIKPGKIANSGKFPEDGDQTFKGTLLPEAYSYFDSGYKVLSFYVNPAALLERAYVLRKDGWRDDDGLYQRMIDRKKVESIRKHLRSHGRVFVNNVIVTLPDETRIDDTGGQPIDAKDIKDTEPVKVRLPQLANSIGIVDGQHRIFSYYEDEDDDPAIRNYRFQQNLLATGIMYPKNLSDVERRKFEASLFLEINSTQKSPASPILQAVGIIMDPYLHDSIGKRVVSRLAQKGPLEGILERHFFDQNVLKTASIVSFGLRRLVRLDGDESLFKAWQSPDKPTVITHQNDEALQDYIKFCADKCSEFLSAAKAVLPIDRWQISTKNNNGLINVVFINGLLILFRKVTFHKGLMNFDNYREVLQILNGFNFNTYRSSQYNRMAEDLFSKIYPGLQPQI